MSKNLKLFKKITLILGVAFLVMGMAPLHVISTDEPPVVEPPADEPPAVESPADEPPAEEPPAEEPPAEEPPAEEPPTEEPPAEEPPAEEPLIEDPLEPMSALSVIGDDPDVEDLIIDHNNYSNGTCNSNSSYCEDLDPVTNPNQYTDMTTYGSKTYTLPQIGSEYPTILVLKNGPSYYWFENGSSESCVGNTFCVEFDDPTHQVTVRSYIPTQQGWDGYNLIDVWLPAPEDCTPTYTDANCPTDCGLDESTHDNGCGGTVTCEETDDCQVCEPIYDETDCPTNCGYDGTDISDGCDGTVECDRMPACGDDDDDDDDDDDESGGGGTPAIIPVTGVDYTMPFAGLQVLSMNMGLMLFGVTMVLEGIDRKRTK